MPANTTDLEKRLWDAADGLRANSGLRSSEYSTPVLGLIFLRFAEQRFAPVERELIGASTGRRTIGPADYQARGVVYLPPEARYGHLLALSVYSRYEAEGEGFVGSYLDLLRAGGSRPPEGLGEIVGVDLTDPGFWNAGLDLIERQLERAERTADALSC